MKPELPFDSQNEILDAIAGQPPSYLAHRAVEEPQKAKLGAIDSHYRAVEKSFQAYFSGQPNPITDKKEKQFVESEMASYLEIYSLIWFGWTEIKAEVAAQQPEHQGVFPATPKALFESYLEIECEAMMSACVDDGVISIRECHQLLGAGNYQTALEAAELDYYSERAKRARHTLNYAEAVMNRSSEVGGLLNFIETAVKKRLRGNSTLRAKLADFRKARSHRTKFLRSFLKKEGIHGEKWAGGQISA